MFSSKYEYSVDEKGRLSVPSRFRDNLRQAKQPEKFYLSEALQGPHRAIWGYPESRYQEIFARLSNLTEEDADQNFLRKFAANMTECPVDKQCRIIVPPALRAYAGITRDVTIIGVYLRIEIWDRTAYQAYEEKVRSVSTPRNMIR